MARQRHLINHFYRKSTGSDTADIINLDRIIE